MSKSVSILVPVFGSDRMVNDQISEAMGPRSWIGIPCAGGMGVLRKLQARSLLVGDKHHFIINLAKVVQSKRLREELVERLEISPFHPNVLQEAQHYCSSIRPELAENSPVSSAFHYFVACWMGRSGISATDDEFTGNLSVRWTSSGGDSNTRYRSAIRGLSEFVDVFQLCNFIVQDVFEFLAHVKDQFDHGLYVDPPWPGDGDSYVHKFTATQQDQLAEALHRFEKTRVVLRFGVHPDTLRRYSDAHWERIPVTSRTQGNNDKAEMLLINRSSKAGS